MKKKFFHHLFNLIVGAHFPKIYVCINRTRGTPSSMGKSLLDITFPFCFKVPTSSFDEYRNITYTSTKSC